jgi:hypothetical protein
MTPPVNVTMGLDDSDGEQAADLAAGQRDQAGGGRPIDVFGCGPTATA